MTELARGSISDRPWGWTFGALGLRGLTGQVVLAVDGKEYVVAFSGGAIVGATSPLVNDAAVRVAMTANLVSPTQVADISRRLAASAGRDEVQIIAESAKLSPDYALRLRRRVIAQRAARTFAFDHGDFVVHDQITLPVFQGTELDVRAVVYLGVRTNLGEDRLAYECQQMGAWFKLRPQAIGDLPQYGFTEVEKPVLERLVAGANLEELVADPSLDARTARTIIYTLASCNACERDEAPRGNGAPRARTPSPGPAVPVSRTATAGSGTFRALDQGRERPPSGSNSAIPVARTHTGSAGIPAAARTPTPGSGAVPLHRAPTPGSGSVPLQRTPTPNDPNAARTPTPGGGTPPLARTPTPSGTIPLTRAPTPAGGMRPPTRPRSTGSFSVPRTATADGVPPGPRSGSYSVVAPDRAHSPSSTPYRTGNTVPPPVRSGSHSAPPPTTSRTGSSTIPPTVARTPTRPGSGSSPPANVARPTRPRNTTAAAAETEKLIDELVPLLDRGADHFAILGVPAEAAPDIVRSAYFNLARKLHPDRLAALGIDDPARNAQRLFAQINAAFGVLSDPARRAEYVSVLRRGSAASLKQEDDKAQDMAAKVMRAEEAFRQGEMAMRREQLQQAIQSFQLAVELQPHEPEYAAMLAWAKFAAAPDKNAVAGATRAALQKAADDAPMSPTGHFYLGRVERMLGREKQALGHFLEVLMIKPHHSEASSEVRILEQRLKNRR